MLYPFLLFEELAVYYLNFTLGCISYVNQTVLNFLFMIQRPCK